MAGQTIVLVLASVAQAGGAAKSWVPYAGPQGSYTVSLPAKPTEMRQGLVASMPGTTVTTEKKIKVAGLTGREVQANLMDPRLPAGGVMLARWVLKGNRVYQAMILRPKESASSEENAKFLESFELTH
jgi:hypothetical protein